MLDCSVAAVAASAAAFVAAALIAKAAEAMLRLVLSWLLSWVMVNRPGGSVSRFSGDYCRTAIRHHLELGQPNKQQGKLYIDVKFISLPRYPM